MAIVPIPPSLKETLELSLAIERQAERVVWFRLQGYSLFRIAMLLDMSIAKVREILVKRGLA